MARNYANILTAIWRDDDFRALTVAGQHAYLLLATQPDISAAGVLPLSVTRWASRATDATRESIVAALQELQAARFVVYDIETEELLVRSFVRWDGGATNPKRRPVILRAASDVESPAIRRVLAAELERAGLPTDGLSDSHADSLSGRLSGSDDRPNRPEPTFPQVDRLSDSQSDTHADRESPSDGVVGCGSRGTYGSYKELSPAASADDAKPETEGQRVNRLARVYTDRVKLSNFNAVAGIVRKAVRAEASDDEITRGLEVLADEERAVTADSLRYAMRGRPTRMGSAPSASPPAPTAIPRAEQCPEHRGQPAGRCAACRTDQRLARTAVTA